MKFDSQGKCLQNMTFTAGNNPGELNVIHGLALDSKGNIYPAEHGSNLQKFVLIK